MLRQVCGDTLQNMWRYLAIYLHILWQVSLLSSITVFLWSHASALAWRSVRNVADIRIRDFRAHPTNPVGMLIVVCKVSSTLPHSRP